MFNVRQPHGPNAMGHALSTSGDGGDCATSASALGQHGDATAGESDLSRCLDGPPADAAGSVESPPRLGLGDLPEDVWGGIVAHLAPVDLLRMGAASQQLREVARQPACWNSHLAALADGESPDASPASPRSAWLEGTAIAHHAPRLRWKRSVHGGAGLEAVALGGNTIVTGGADGTAQLWGLTTGRRGHRLAHGGKVLAVAIASDTVMTGSGDTTAKLWSVNDGALQYTLRGHARGVCAVALGGEVVASGDDGGGLRLWTKAGEPVWNLEAHPQKVTSVVFWGDQLFTTSYDQSIGIFAAGDGRRCGSVAFASEVMTLGISRDRIAAGTLDGTAVLARNASAVTLTLPRAEGVPLHAMMAGLSLVVGYGSGLAQVHSLIDGQPSALIDDFVHEGVVQVAARGKHIVVGGYWTLRAYVCAPERPSMAVSAYERARGLVAGLFAQKRR